MSAVVADDKAQGASELTPDVSAVKPFGQDKSVSAQPAPSETPEPKVPSFFSKRKEAADKPSDDLSLGVDVSKLDPKLQPVYKQMQAGLTQKFQSMADEQKKWREDFEGQKTAFAAEREALQKNHEALLAAFTRGKPEEGAPQALDTMAQIQALRDEGKYQEADALFVKHVEQLADERIKPIEARANADRQAAAFLKLAETTIVGNPMVAEYRGDVISAWDSKDPTQQAIRTDILSSPEAMQRYFPMYVELIALRSHAKRLEENIDSIVTSRVKALQESNRAKARSVPPSLVSSGGVSRDTKGSGGGLEGAFQRALEKVQGA
jgi:hypothetical protein